MRLLNLTLIAAALLLATSLSACGGDPTAEYRSGVEIAGSNFKDAAAPALQSLRTAPSTATKLAAVRDFKAAVDRAALDFEHLHPPDEARSDNARLVAQFHGLSSDLVDFEHALAGSDSVHARELAATVQRDFGQITATSARLNRDVGA